MFSGCSDGSCGPGGIWWSFQMKVWTLMIQRNSVIPKYSMISAIRWSPAIRWSQAIWSSIGSIDFDSPKVYGDTSITGGLVYFCQKNEPCPKLSQHSPNMMPFHTWGRSWGVSSQEIRTLGQELGPWNSSSASGSWRSFWSIQVTHFQKNCTESLMTLPAGKSARALTSQQAPTF